MNLVKPPMLREGSQLAVMAPSSDLAAHFPHRLERGVAALHELGFDVETYPSTKQSGRSRAGSAETRAAELHRAFRNPDVDGIIMAIGGLFANELLPHLNFETFREHPTVVCGYSDCTNLLNPIWQRTGLVTFHGPMVLTQFGEHPEPMTYTVESFLRTLTKDEPIGPIEGARAWTDEILDWGNKEDLERPRAMKESDGFVWLHPGQARGRLVGGCLPAVLQLSGTRFEIDYTNKILLLETPPGHDLREPTPLENVDSQLVDLELRGVFSKINGLIFGRCFGYDEQQNQAFRDIVTRRLSPYNIPVVVDVDAGHTDPVETLPIGLMTELDSGRNLLRIDESAVAGH